MNYIIAVDDDLGNIREYLAEQGFETISLADDLVEVPIVIVSGMDTNPLGDTDITTDATIINADGLTAEEVLEEVERVMELVL